MYVSTREGKRTAGSGLKNDDVTPLMNSGYTVTGTLAEGHDIVAVVSGSQTEIGQRENEISSYTITDENGNDVTANHSVRLVGATLQVIP